MDFQIDHKNVQSANTTFTPTDKEKNDYAGFALAINADVSFDGGSQAFPLKAGVPMLFPVNMTSIQTSVSTALYYGLDRKCSVI